MRRRPVQRRSRLQYARLLLRQEAASLPFSAWFEATLIKAGFKLTREGNKRIYKKPGGKITIQPTEEET
jgi:hypothetical protein